MKQRLLTAAFAVLVVATFGAMSSGQAFAQYYGQGVRGEGNPTPTVRPKVLDEVGVDEHVGAQLPMDARVTTHDGRNIALGDLFNRTRPVIVQFAYYTCPSLCSMVVKGLTASLRDLRWTAGQEFDVVTISIDPRDTQQTATAKRREALAEYGRSDAMNAWTFVTGTEDSVKRIADAAGFNYAWDPSQEQYAHSAALVFASPDGHISRYLYGLEYEATNLRLALIDASQGKAISTFDPIIRYCYTFSGSKYVLVAARVMKVGGAITLLLVASMLGFFWTREFRKRDTHHVGPSGIVGGKA